MSTRQANQISQLNKWCLTSMSWTAALETDEVFCISCSSSAFGFRLNENCFNRLKGRMIGLVSLICGKLFRPKLTPVPIWSFARRASKRKPTNCSTSESDFCLPNSKLWTNCPTVCGSQQHRSTSAVLLLIKQKWFWFSKLWINQPIQLTIHRF